MRTAALRDHLGSFRGLSRAVWLCLALAAVAGFTVSGGIYGVLLNLYLLRLGYNTQFIGLVNAMSPLAIVVFSLPASALGSRWGNGRVMTAGLALCAVGHGLLALPNPPLVPLSPWLLGCYLAGGAGMALYLVNLTPFLTGLTKPSERNYAFSARMALLPLAAFAGSLVGGLLPGLFARLLSLNQDAPEAYRYALLTAAVLLLLSLPVAFAADHQGRTRTPHGSVPVDHADAPDGVAHAAAPIGTMLLLALVGTLRVMGEGVPRAFFNVYLDTRLGLSAAQIGGLVAGTRLLSVPAGLLMPAIAGRWGNARTVAGGAVGVALSLVPMALVPHWAAAGVSYVSLTAMAAVARGAFMVHCMGSVPARWRSTLSAMTTMSASVSWALTSFVGGYLIDRVGYGGAYLSGAGFVILGAALFAAAFLRRASSGPHVPLAAEG